MKAQPFVLIAVAFFLMLGFTQTGFSQSQATQMGSGKLRASDYHIGAGDVLEIATWKEPELTRKEVLVRVDGKISFPLIGDIQAAGVTPVELTEALQKGLKNYVTSPVVTVTVINPGSQKIYILGEVQRTGEYPLAKSLTVLQAFAIAGGFTQWASKDEIILLRREGAQEKIYKINYKDIVKGRTIENNVALQANDTIVVP